MGGWLVIMKSGIDKGFRIVGQLVMAYKALAPVISIPSSHHISFFQKDSVTEI
jgi:hypothetical protein